MQDASAVPLMKLLNRDYLYGGWPGCSNPSPLPLSRQSLVEGALRPPDPLGERHTSFNDETLPSASGGRLSAGLENSRFGMVGEQKLVTEEGSKDGVGAAGVGAAGREGVNRGDKASKGGGRWRIDLLCPMCEEVVVTEEQVAGTAPG